MFDVLEPTSYITVQTSYFLYLLFDACMTFGRCKVGFPNHQS